MALTVSTRAVATATSTATTTKGPVTFPGSYAAGDLLTLFYYSAAGSPDANPSGWTSLASGNDGSGYWAVWTKKATAGDISTGSVSVASAAGGKANLALLACYAASADVSALAVSTKQETVTTATHGANAISVPGAATVASFLGLKDTTADVSGSWAAPAGLGTPVTATTTGGSSNVTVGVALTSGTDVAAGSYGGGTSWTVTKADGTTAAPSNHAVVVTVAYCAVLRPSADVTNPSGATFTGGATLTAVAGDDDPASYMEFTGAGSLTFEARIAVNGTVPSFVQVDMASTGGATATSVHGYLYLGATQLLDLGTDSTLITASGRSIVWSLSALTGGNKTSILADPTNLRLRCVCTVS